MFGRLVNGFASSTHSSRERLARELGRTTQPLRSSPTTGPSSLQRAAPPLCSASVLWPSWFQPLGRLLWHRNDRFSRSILEPSAASRRLHAGRRSIGTTAPFELVPGEWEAPGFDVTYSAFDASSIGLLALAFPHLACRDQVPTFLQRSPPSLFTTACSGLEPAPDHRLRGGLPHLSYSCASPCGPAMLVTRSREADFQARPGETTPAAIIEATSASEYPYSARIARVS
jgi:hypothetical protein